MTLTTDAGVVNGSNVTTIDFGDAGQQPMGAYVDLDAGSWCETNREGHVAFNFRETNRDEWSVYLTDSQRGISLQIDLFKRRIFVSTASASNQPLYAVLAYAETPGAAPAFRSLATFNTWFASDGPHRAGMTAESMQPLNSAIVDLRSHAREIANDLQTMPTTWGQIESSHDSASTSALLAPFVADLAAARSKAEAFVAAGARARTLITEATTALNTHTEQNRQHVTQSQIALNGARERQAAARASLASANAQLRGDQGFLNGLLTGITLSAYNPVAENIDKAKQAVATINGEVATIDQQMAALRTSTIELAEGKLTLKYLAALDAALAGFQNVVSQAESSLSVAHDDAARAEAAGAGRLGAYYAQKAGNDMHALFGWIEPLTSAL